MTASLKPYPAYKPSGVEWLGEIPEGWKVVRLKSLEGNRSSTVQTGPFGAQLHASDYVDEGIPLVLIRNVGDMQIHAENIPRVSLKDAKRLSMYRLRKGDIVFSRVGSIGRIALCTEREDGWLISGQMLRLRITNPCLQDRFAAYAFGCSSLLTFVELRSVGSTRESLNTDILREMPVPIPPLPEQHRIATFLDQKTAEIDEAISKKQRLIELLKEQKAILINQAVTKGLNPNIPMRDSGVEWIGKIPAHWEIWQIGRFSRVGNGSTPSRSNTTYWSNGTYPWLNSSSVNQGTITKADQFVTDRAMRECHLPRVPSGSVLVAITGQGKTRGKAAILAREATINQHMAYISPKMTRVSSDYLQMYLSAAYGELRAISDASGSTKGALTCEDIKRFKVALPPRDEQERLLSSVRQELTSVEAASTRINRQIDLLQEYRTILIADVVTGKLDVREDAHRES